jgi:hypothetical protein
MAKEGVFNWRWRGLACLELRIGQHTILVDPCFRRFAPWRMLWGRLTPTPATALDVADCETILITHPHWDHLLDTPQLAVHAPGGVYGSAQTADLLKALGVPAGRIHRVAAGDALSGDGFYLEVLPAQHERVPGFEAAELPPHLAPPLRAREYKPDVYYSFLITLGGMRVLTDPGVNPAVLRRAEVLFIQPQRDEAYYREVLNGVEPCLVVPIHWDSLFHASANPRQSYLRPRFGWPPLTWLSLPRFSALVARLRPAARVIVPQIDAWYRA